MIEGSDICGKTLSGDGCRFVATNSDRTFPGRDAILPGGGTIVNADRETKGDILTIGEKIAAVSETPLEAPAGKGSSAEVVKALQDEVQSWLQAFQEVDGNAVVDDIACGCVARVAS